MEKKSSLHYIQVALMAAGSALMFPYTFMPIINSPPANQDIWVSLLLAVVYILVINAPFLFIINKFKGICAMDTMKILAGKVGGPIILTMFSIFSVFCLAACMLLTAIYIGIYVLAETPLWATLFLIIVPVTYGAYKGAGTIGRLATFVIPFILLTVLFFMALGTKIMDFNALKPILADSTFLEINEGALLTATRYSEIMIIFVMSFFLKKKSTVNKSYFSALGIFGVTFFIMVMSILLVLGQPFAAYSNNPYYLFTRQVGGADFIQRVQSFNLLAWFTGTLMKLMIYNFMASFMMSGVIKKVTQKKLVIPISLIAITVCLIPVVNKTSFMHLLSSDRFFPFVVAFMIVVIPVILVFLYLIRKKKIDAQIQEKYKMQEEEEKREREIDNEEYKGTEPTPATE